MRLLSWLLCAAAAIVPVITSEEKNISRPKRDSSDKKIVCYYTNWSVYRPGTAKFSPQNINPYLCTHLIYAFGGLSKENALKPFDKYQDIEQGGYAKFNGLKTYNKNLKTMLAIGGWNEGSARFSPLVADAERRRELVKNTVKFLRQNHFDGLDLDWEYPSFRDGGKPRDRDNYATLVQEFREEFERESEKTGRPRLLLTMAVPAGIEYIDKGYDVPKLNKYLDWMNILSYDYHSAFEPTINHHSPLLSLEEDDEYNFDAQLNIEYTVQHYIKQGAERSKLVLGIPTYGRSYTLFNPDATDIGSPADGPGEQGEATREKGYLAYYEICERVKSGGWSVENPNPEAMGPFAYKDNQWVGYDDEDIVRAKAKYVNDNDLGGIMFWSIDNDDFRGKCHGKPYPLIEAAKEALLASANELVPSKSRSESSRSSSKKQEETTPKPKTRKSRLRTKSSSTTTESSKSKSNGRTSTTPQPPTTPDPGSDFVCKDEGFFPHPRDCKKYFWCLDSGPSSLGIVAHQFTCPSGLVFNKISDSCDYPRNVICKNKPEATTTTTTTTSTTTARTTTARNRLVITATPPRSTTTTTTTTTEPPEEDEEDPGTIKELINLIKKLGGVEQLEKQLKLQNSDEKENIKSSLYSRVLQGRTANRYRGVVTTQDDQSTQKYVPQFRNRPIGPQGPSTEEISTSTRGLEKPRYVTIQRNRPTKKPTKVEEESEEEEEEVEEEVEEPEQQKIKDENPRPFRKRTKPETTTEKEYVVLRRSRPPKEEVSTSKYKNIVRTRSTTEAPVEEEIDDEEEPEGEETSEEEEEEVVENEEQEIEPGQKLKKYSSIIRDNKKVVPDEEESKVSGSVSEFVSGGSSSTTDSGREERINVNSVNTVTSPRYVEIRRTQPTSTESTVNIVNISHKTNRDDKETSNEVDENDKESKINGFRRRITTDIVGRSTRPITGFSLSERTTPVSVESSDNYVPTRFKGRFRSNPTTELPTSPETQSFSRYKTLNRNNAGKPILIDEKETEKQPKRNRAFKSSTVAVSSTTETNTNTASRRFQFAPRTKPTVLQPKPLESTTESFTITVPSLPDSNLTENILVYSSNEPFPSATLEPGTATAPSLVDSTFLDVTENDVVRLTVTGEKSLPPSTRFYIPTTSTLTSIVTSITESSFTERKRISVPKKSFFNPELETKYDSFIIANTEAEETTKPLLRPLSYKSITRSTTQEVDTETEPKRRRFKPKFTSLTTTEPVEVPEKKYVPKKVRGFKKIANGVSTESPEVTSTLTDRGKFQPRNKSKQNEKAPNNSLYSRFNQARRQKVLFRKENDDDNDDDDLDVQQTATFFGDDVENNERFILGGALKQTSEKEHLNADVFFITVPSVEKEENLIRKPNEELTNSLELTKITSTPTHQYNKSVEETAKEPVRNRFITNNSNLINLRSRTRKFVESTTQSSSQTVPEPSKATYYTPNPRLAFKSIKIRNKETNDTGSEITENDTNNFNKNEHTKESARKKVVGFNRQAANLRSSKYKRPDNEENKRITAEESGEEGGFGTKEPNKPNFYTPNPSSVAFRPSRGRTKYGSTTEAISIDTNDIVESYPENSIRPNSNSRQTIFRGGAREAGQKNETSNNPQDRNFRNLRARTRRPFENSSEKVTVDSSTFKTSLPSRITKRPTSFSTPSDVKFKTTDNGAEDSKSAGATFSASYELANSFEPITNNVIIINDENVKDPGVQTLQYSANPTVSSTFGSTINALDDTTFGVKIGSTLGSTRSLFGSTFDSTTRSTFGSTVRPASGSTLNPSTETSVKTTYSSKITSSVTSASTSTPNSFGTTISGSSTPSKLDPTPQFIIDSNSASPIVSTFRPTFTSNTFSRNTKNTFAPQTSTQSSSRTLNTQFNEVSDFKTPQPGEIKKELPIKEPNLVNPDLLNTRNFRGRSRQNVQESSRISDTQNIKEPITGNAIQGNSDQAKFKVLRIRNRGKINATESLGQAAERASVNETTGNDRRVFLKDRRRVLVRARPVEPPSEKPEENKLESPEELSSTSKTTTGKRVNQDYFTSLRTRGRSTTQAPTSTERTERKRVQTDRRRFKPETRSTTLKPEPATEISNPSRSNALLRKRVRPTTSTTTTTTSTSTTEVPYIEKEEDSNLEESKTLDETPDIQDLADPAVVAIHTLATVSPGPIAPVVSPVSSYSQTPATYTVHVTPSDIASITTPTRISSTPGSVSRPASILTLKPFTVPVITKQYIAKQTPVPVRTPSPFRAQAISEEPFSPSGVLIQSRRQEATQRTRPAAPVVATATQKETPAKSRRVKPFSKVPKQEVAQSVNPSEPSVDYEYYDDDEDPLANIPASALKVKVHSDGYIECLDRGNFPHPFSCKKFISCAKMENNELLGWEYTCPKHLSFDPVGGICNWSAGLGCQH